MGKRNYRRWSASQKKAILEEAKQAGVIPTCRKHGIYAATFYDWKRKYNASGEVALERSFDAEKERDYRRLQKENEELKRALAEKELDLRMKGRALPKKLRVWRHAKL